MVTPKLDNYTKTSSKHMEPDDVIKYLIINGINSEGFKWGYKRCPACVFNKAIYCNPNDKLGHLAKV